MKNYKFVFLVALLMLVASCDDYVTSVDSLADRVDDEALNDVKQLEFLITGLEHQFTVTTDDLLGIADGLSDQFDFGYGVKNATYSSYIDIDDANIRSDNNSSRLDDNIHRLRFYADTLLVRIDNHLTGVTDADSAKIDEAKHAGNFFSAIAKYYLATYYGKSKTEGGATINNSAFIPANTLYQQALASFNESLKYADSYQKKLVNSYMARIHLFMGNFDAALTAAEKGLQFLDAPHQALFTKVSNNNYWIHMGGYRAQFIPSPRFTNYINEDPTEAKRIKLTPLGSDDRTGQNRNKSNMYPDNDSPINVMTWEENHLMLAELKVRGHGTADPLALINEIRKTHEVSLLSGPIDLDAIYLERDKQLFLTGLRLPDQRRFGKFHIVDGWQYFPLSIDEENGNPNY